MIRVQSGNVSELLKSYLNRDGTMPYAVLCHGVVKLFNLLFLSSSVAYLFTNSAGITISCIEMMLNVLYVRIIFFGKIFSVIRNETPVDVRLFDNRN